MTETVWINPLQYPADGRLRVLLMTRAGVPASDSFRPVIGCRINGAWQMIEPKGGTMVALPDSMRVYGWQEIAHAAAVGCTDDDLLTSLRSFVRCEHVGLVLAMDIIGWFHSVTAPMVAELTALRASAKEGTK